jgi:hypothetical protein
MHADVEATVQEGTDRHSIMGDASKDARLQAFVDEPNL